MISNAVIGTTTTDLITVPSGKTYSSVVLLFCNTESTDEVVTIYAIPTGGTASGLTTIVKSMVIPAQNTWEFTSKLLLSAGDKVSAVGVSGAKVTVTSSFIEL